jgi:superfamily II DNA or RNA helicase
LRHGLFDGLTSFPELEQRITNFPTALERGEAFEVFAEAYLATLAIQKAKRVWPGKSVPHSLRMRLALTLGDKGVDGVFETELGEYHAYQAKFRTGRPSLTWDELSTFIGLADRVDHRVLFTNCDRFADVVKQRTGFYAVTGNDLDRLQPADFAAIRAWLEGARIERPPKTPLPHQAEALDEILPALRQNDRATALMACGTGKTLVALWVAEHTGARNVLVLVPSLALLRQTLHEWARETSWGSFASLCVCSDPSVKPDTDEIILRSSDLDFPVTTDASQVREFLVHGYDGVKLVFSTYQSAHVVAAGMKRGDAFDLAIFDEAHKTAGRQGVHFSFALNDINLAIRKRLFLTATPRHYDVRKRDDEGDARLVYSMDAPEVYGPVAHKLTFAEAARRGIICRYKVIISVVTSDMVTDHLLRHGEVIVKGDAIKARHVANQLALQAAIEKHGVSKIFTFHRSVASAAAFTSDGSEGIANHLSGFDAFHINGSMPTSERENIMSEFRAASCAVISNAKCLTEGVDVPAVDMVAFLTPKRSRVDIVQATGRAMRKARGKTTGYVLVPLFVEQAKGETIEEAIARTEFDEVWNVLQAMQEQDDMLAEIIRKMREERGRTKGFNDTRFSEKVEFLGAQISLETLRNSITTACVEALGDNWDEKFGELEAFKDHYGHCNVSSRWPVNKKLGRWCVKQRTTKMQEKLRKERIARLDALGFDWGLHDSQWKEMLEALALFRKQHGHSNVPSFSPDNKKLGLWCTTQRATKTQGNLSQERIARLNALGFDWGLHASQWDDMFEALTLYKEKQGHCNVPLSWPENKKLGRWCNKQRATKTQGRLSKERITRLEALGFEWDPIASQWNGMFEALALYKEKQGHCNVPSHWPENRKLGAWCSTQRTSKLRGKLSKEYISRLNALGFEWDPITSQWDDMFETLALYKENHGHCNVPSHWPENKKLGAWCSSQRTMKKRGSLSKECIERLDALAFEWNMRAYRWEEMFLALCSYKETHGNCIVPRHWPENKKLASWCRTQRKEKKNGVLSEDRTRRLSEIDFQWNTNMDTTSA